MFLFANAELKRSSPIPLISSRGHCGSSVFYKFYLFILVFFFPLKFGIPVRRGKKHSVMVIIFSKVKGNIQMIASFFKYKEHFPEQLCLFQLLHPRL